MRYEISIMISEEVMHRNDLLSLTKNGLFASESKWFSRPTLTEPKTQKLITIYYENNNYIYFCKKTNIIQLKIDYGLSS